MPSADCDLLRQYADQGDETAFAEVVRRQANLVYSAALRVAGNDALAQEVTQVVFTKLAHQARPVSRYETLVGWLHTTTRYTAINAIRGEERRRARDQEAFAMQNETSPGETKWEQLRPLLDEAVGRLREAERQAVLLRFFSGLSHQQVGAELGLTENAAQKRVERALDKLRTHFTRRGVTITAALLAATLSENSVQAAPVELATKATRASFVGAGVATESVFLKILFMSTKTKLSAALVVLGLAIILALNWPWIAKQPLAASQAAPVVASPIIVAPSSSAAGNGTVADDPIKAGVSPVAKGASAVTMGAQPIRFAPEPANGRDVVMAMLKKRAAGLPTDPALMDFGLVEVKPLLEYYNLSTITLADGGGLETAQLDGFSYLIQSSGKPYVRALVQANEAGTTKFVNFVAGTDETTQPLTELANLSEVKKGSYEARRLLVRMDGATGPTLVSLIWLKSDPGGADLIYPYAYGGRASEFQKNRLYTVEEFLNTIRPIAKAKVANRFPPAGG